MSEESLKLVELAHEYLNEGDIDALIALCDADFELDMLCTGESYKDKVKLTFLKGASLEDPAKLFNSSLDGNARRAIDIHEGEEVDPDAFKTLIRAAVDLNTSG